MKVTVKVKGIEAVMVNLNKEVTKMNFRSMRGMIRAAAFIRRDMDKTPPLIPVHTNKLRGSWFTSPYYLSPLRPVVLLGFAANYAWVVHENVDAEFRRPGAGAKFLEAALKRNHEKILAIMREESKQ